MRRITANNAREPLLRSDHKKSTVLIQVRYRKGADEAFVRTTEKAGRNILPHVRARLTSAA